MDTKSKSSAMMALDTSTRVKMRSPRKKPFSEEYLTDAHVHTFNLILSISNVYEVNHQFREKSERGKDIGNFKSSMVDVVVPQLYLFPNLIFWCEAWYEPFIRVMVFVDHKKTIVDITP